jgi:hypothetical protein
MAKFASGLWKLVSWVTHGVPMDWDKARSTIVGSPAPDRIWETIPPGSIVQIDTRGRAISSAPRLFPHDPGGVCLRLVRIGQELGMADPDSSSAIARLEAEDGSIGKIENLGRVISVVIRLEE